MVDDTIEDEDRAAAGEEAPATACNDEVTAEEGSSEGHRPTLVEDATGVKSIPLGERRVREGQGPSLVE